MTAEPGLKLRPRLDRWLRDRGMGAGDLGRRWEMTPQGAARYLLPFGHKRRIVPSETQIADVLAWTRGEIVAADWYPPELSGAPVTASVGTLPAQPGEAAPWSPMVEVIR